MTTNKYKRTEDRNFWNFTDKSLPDAIIVDIDGTLALFGMENPYERDYSKDMCNPVLKSIIWGFQSDAYYFPILIVSGRFEKYRDITTKWLFDNDVPYIKLFMRPDSDTRKDDILKEEIYNSYIKDKYNVLCAFDDRKRIKRMWNKLGIYVFDVNQTDEDY